MLKLKIILCRTCRIWVLPLLLIFGVASSIRANVLHDIYVVDRLLGTEQHTDQDYIVVSSEASFFSIDASLSVSSEEIQIEVDEDWLTIVSRWNSDDKVSLLLNKTKYEGDYPRFAQIKIADAVLNVVQRGTEELTFPTELKNVDQKLTIEEEGMKRTAAFRYIVSSSSHALLISDDTSQVEVVLDENQENHPRFETVTVGDGQIDIIQQGVVPILFGSHIQNVQGGYISTGIVPQKDYQYEVRGWVKSYGQSFFGACSKNSQDDRILFQVKNTNKNIPNSSNICVWHYGHHSTPESFSYPNTITYFWAHCSPQGLIMKSAGLERSEFVRDPQPWNHPTGVMQDLYIFANNNGGGGAGLCTGTTRLDYLKIREGETLVHYLVPSVNEENVSCLYDLIDNRYIIPKGKGCLTETHELLYNGLITIIEDDGRSRLIDDGIIDLYDNYGIVPTLAINPGQIKVGSEGEKQQRNSFPHSNGSVVPLMSFNEIKGLYEKGYDIQDHSWSHAHPGLVWFTDDDYYEYEGEIYNTPAGPSWWLDEALPQQAPYIFGGPWLTKTEAESYGTDTYENCKNAVILELQKSQEWLLEHLGITYHDILVAPKDNKFYNTEIKNAGYKYVTNGNNQNSSTALSSVQSLGAQQVVFSRFYLTDNNISKLKTHIDDAVANNKWLILLIHSVSPAELSGKTAAEAGKVEDDNYGVPHTQTYGTKLGDSCGTSISYDTYIQLFEKIKSSGINCATFHDAVTTYELAK